MPTQSATERIASLQAEINALKEKATQELKERRVALAQELTDIDSEIAKLTGKTPEGTKRRYSRRSSSSEARQVSFQELKSMLSAAPDKMISLRNEGLDAKNVRQLVEGNPGTLRMGGKGAWPTVTLVK